MLFPGLQVFTTVLAICGERQEKNRRGQLERIGYRDQNSKEKVMTTRIRTLLGSILLLMATMASAQVVQRVTVTVPFSFAAGSHNLPAGDYTIELNYQKGAMILRSEASGSINPVAILPPTTDEAAHSRTSAFFHLSPPQHSLPAITTPASQHPLTPH